VIRATASAALPRPTVRGATSRRPFLLTLLLMTVLALVGTGVVGQRAAAAELNRDDIRVSVDGVAFERGRQSDEVAYVVRPAGSYGGARAYARDLSRDEQNSGWASFWEARRAYPDGYCVVWVEVEDASSWHERGSRTACTAPEPVVQPAPSAPASTPTPTPTATSGGTPTQESTTPAAPPEAAAAAPPSTPTPTPAPAETTAPTPSPAPTPTPTPSPSPSATPSPSPSETPADATLLRGLQDQSPVRAQASAAQQDEIISPLGWVAVLGSGAVLTAGGLLMLWRRIT